jgi:serine protease Do
MWYCNRLSARRIDSVIANNLPTVEGDRGTRDQHRPHLYKLILVAVCFTCIGLLIASRFDFTGSTVAQVATNISQTGAYPVVDRDGEYESPFVAVVEKVQSAVVNISARSQETQVPWWHQRGNFATSSGSGFFFREDGYILTNAHVVKDAEKLTVTTASGYKYPAKLVGSDPGTDLAVIKIDPKPDEKITIIPFGDSDNLRVGDWAIAIGNPFPQQGLDRTVTVGVISAVGRGDLFFGAETPQYQSYIQTDASINPGNSGGPLLNLRGECVGINAAISSPTGTSVGIGFAIPVSLARSIVPDLIATGKASRGWLGVWLDDITEAEAQNAGLKEVKGVMVDKLFPNSPAEKAGVKPGDIVVAFNGHPVANRRELSVLVSTIKGGQPVPMDIIRDGEEVRLTTVIGDKDQFLTAAGSADSINRAGKSDTDSRSWLGMELTPFTVDKARTLGAEFVAGLYVEQVFAGTPADNASITRGTVVLQVEGEAVKNLDDILRVQKTASQDGRVSLIVVEPDGTIARKVVRL